jgi:hypothetical protein
VQALTLALEGRGESERARATLDAALARRPRDRELRAATLRPCSRRGPTTRAHGSSSIASNAATAPGGG